MSTKTKQLRRCRSLLAVSRQRSQSSSERAGERTCVSHCEIIEITVRREYQTEANCRRKIVSLSSVLTRLTETEACLCVIDFAARVRSRCICFVAGRPAHLFAPPLRFLLPNPTQSAPFYLSSSSNSGSGSSSS